MKLIVKGNPNYCATIVAIENIIPLEGCDNIQATTIFGNNIIISKDTKVGDIGIFFPVECSIKEIFLKANNLYREKQYNVDQTKAGFFELNGRVRCMKLRGFKSEGFWIPLNSLEKFGKFDELITLKVTTEFDHINGEMICEKYVVKTKNQNASNSKKQGKKSKVKLIVEDQFRFHKDTTPLGKQLMNLHPNSWINLSVKYHGTSAIFSNILIYKKLNLFEKLLLKLGVNINTTTYNNIYSSRKVIKNEVVCENPTGFYSSNIWKKANNTIKEKLEKGITIYAEIVGYIEQSKFIQKDYDYGCKPNEFKIYVYRVTYTNTSGNVFEMSFNQMKNYCKKLDLNVVETLYQGYAKDLYPEISITEHWHQNFYNKLINDQNFNMELNCPYCQNKVPFEGLVLRIDNLDFEAYKIKCFAFKQHESILADKGIEDIEELQS